MWGRWSMEREKFFISSESVRERERNVVTREQEERQGVLFYGEGRERNM
jgi:hypothetical protein